MPTDLGPIPNMIKHSFPSVKALETNGTMKEIADIVFPNGFNIVDFEGMHKASCCLEVASKGHPSRPQTKEVSGCSEELGDPCGGQ